ncbi:type 1 fimbrial protein [Enterobacter bugandensis]|uniref:Type 1 fimbrial protein n=2 Tax=Enterobacteriaceae TaxID=543 RepID=A0ABX4VDI6_9ENTR|nr:type 1 fimbrial protein [Enterobacter bugandensis]PNF51325.1 type 1 fimbrial protein [Enterobacter bugandensis]PNF61733.1 type 1 fimbrial protein [Enterobacter bugandensis]PNF66371.1 type 1 fimbrial protein [Enterobacter bugandensis]RKN87169.1 type 1 fimbrial protein [Enterobacter bugandensis]
MGGLVVDSACALHPDSYQQYIFVDDFSIDRMIRNEGSELHPFSVNLINCTPWSENKNDRAAFQITFEGQVEGRYFSLQGSAKGLAIEIQDDRGHIAIPGVPMMPHPIPQGERTLNYNLRLVGNSELLRVGEHFALIKYKLDYY